MIKARNKKISLLMTIVFLFTIMVPLVGPAAAGTTYTAHSARSWDSNATNAQFKFSVKIDPCDKDKHGAIVKFPSDVLIDTVTISGSVSSDVYFAINNTRVNLDAPANIGGDSEFKLDVINNGPFTKVEFTVTVVAKLDNFDGIINAEIDRLYGDFVNGTITGLGKAGDGDITVTTGEVPVITESGNDISKNPVVIYMKENTKNAVAGKSKALKVKLPKGFEWDVVKIYDITTGKAVYSEVYSVDDGKRSIVISGKSAPLDADTDVPNYVKITASIKVIDKKAKFGDIVASLSSDVDVEPSEIIVAKYGDYTTTVEAAEDDVYVLAGRYGEEISDILIKEEAPGTLVAGRSITLTLPSYAKWGMKAGTNGELTPSDFVKREDGDKVDIKSMYYVDDRTIKCILQNASEDDPATLKFKDLKVHLAGDATGELVVEVAGSAGVEGEVVVAEIYAPVEVESSPVDVKIGLQAQPIGDITITETVKEAIKEGDLELRLPAGVYWAGTPDVTVDGDLEIGEVKIDLDTNTLVIPIEDKSDEASTITITDAKVTVSRSLPEGEIEVKVGGYAVNQTYYGETSKEPQKGIFRAWTVASAVAGKCITPAPAETIKTAVFTLNSTTYVVDGVEQTMDVAAFAENGRTYLPIRYAALALGVNDSNILWDGATQTVTLLKGEKAVQVKVGSKEMLINGVTVMMDVTPTAKDGRVFLPFRWIAMAFGANVDYDAANQTVTMTLDTAQRN